MIPEVGRTKSGNACSWCLEAANVAPTPGDSHGICEYHFLEIKARVLANKARRTT
jgi:hypothetical protein